MINKSWISENTGIIAILVFSAFIVIIISIIRFFIQITKYGFSNYFSRNGVLYGVKHSKEIENIKE